MPTDPTNPTDLIALEARIDALEAAHASFEARIADLEAAVQEPLKTIAAALTLDQDTRAQSLEVLRRCQVHADELVQRADFARKLEAFFGPMLQTMTPPLNGDDVATRGYVDQACERLSGRLRDHVAKVADALTDATKRTAPAKRPAPAKRSPGRKR